MAYIQLSLFGKTSWERFLQITGWTLEPSCNPSQTPRFQCLLLEDGRAPEWCEGEGLTSAGGSWTPRIGEGPRSPREESVSSSWSILEESVPETFYLNPAVCSRLLRLAETAGFPPPERIEYLLKKQGGAYPSSIPFKQDGCAEPQGTRTGRTSSGALDGQMTLSQLCSPET